MHFAADWQAGKEIPDAARIASADCRAGDIVPALKHPLGYPRNGDIQILDKLVVLDGFPALAPPGRDLGQNADARQRGQFWGTALPATSFQ